MLNCWRNYVAPMKSSEKTADNRAIRRQAALQVIPMKSRMVTESRLDSGEVLVTYPVAVRPWMAKVLNMLGRTPDKPVTRKLQLDALGTMVWDLLDGKRSVQELIERFASDHQLQTREAEISVTQFLRELGRRGIIGMR